MMNFFQKFLHKSELFGDQVVTLGVINQEKNPLESTHAIQNQIEYCEKSTKLQPEK
jgi:hypothetical protein